LFATIKSWNIEAVRELVTNNPQLNIDMVTCKEDLTYERVKNFNPRYVFFPHWSWMIPKKIYDNFECVVFHMTDLPFGRVQNLEDILIDPHLGARNRFQYFEFRGRKMPMIAPYPLLSETPGSVHSLWPAIGQHNDEIYRKLLGFSLDEIQTFKSERVI